MKCICIQTCFAPKGGKRKVYHEGEYGNFPECPIHFKRVSDIQKEAKERADEREAQDKAAAKAAAEAHGFIVSETEPEAKSKAKPTK